MNTSGHLKNLRARQSISCLKFINQLTSGQERPKGQPIVSDCDSEYDKDAEFIPQLL